jgi:ferredoxin-type protein NapH
MKSDKTFQLSSLKIPGILLLVFWAIAIILWQTTGKIFYLFNFGYIGLALAIGIGTYSVLPRRKKLWGRRLAQFLIGAYMLVFLGFIGRENMQIEGFFLYLLSGYFAGSVIHYLVAKLAGPLIFNRGWCGWACWTAMILDLLPYKRNKAGRLSAKWDALRYLHFFLSLGLILVLWFGFNYRVADQSMAELYWMIGGNVLYYGLGIGLAFALKDNRAFCKYICPIPTLQKITSRFSLIKIKGKTEACTNCGACNKICPMDIRVSDYILNHQRVLSSECILCFECTNVCPTNALDSNFAFDFGTTELLTRRDNQA